MFTTPLLSRHVSDSLQLGWDRGLTLVNGSRRGKERFKTEVDARSPCFLSPLSKGTEPDNATDPALLEEGHGADQTSA